MDANALGALIFRRLFFARTFNLDSTHTSPCTFAQKHGKRYIIRYVFVFSSHSFLSIYRDSGVLDSRNRMRLRDLLEARPICIFFYPISMPSPPVQIDNRLPRPPTFALLLTLPLSSPKQTDCRNVVSSHPYCRHGFTPGRRRRRRHLSYMRGCLHLQHQNNRSNLPSGPKPDLIPINPFAVHSYSLHCGTLENKIHYICRSSHPSSYFKNSYNAHTPQKAKQKYRCIQPSQAPWSSPKDDHPHKAALRYYLECKRQKVHQAEIYGQRHDRKLLEAQDDRW